MKSMGDGHFIGSIVNGKKILSPANSQTFKTMINDLSSTIKQCEAKFKP